MLNKKIKNILNQTIMKHFNTKTLFTTLIFASIILFSSSLFAQLNTPRGSQRATVKQTVGITSIAINYSRPSVKEREIWGKLVPYGMNNLGFGTAKESPWRAGADENTIIKFSDDVNFNITFLISAKGENESIKPFKYFKISVSDTFNFIFPDSSFDMSRI